MDWKCVDEGLIRRGELLLSLNFLEEYEFELSVINGGKVRCLFKLTNEYAEFLTVDVRMGKIIVMDVIYSDKEKTILKVLEWMSKASKEGTDMLLFLEHTFRWIRIR